jgi:hypothetical protein
VKAVAAKGVAAKREKGTWPETSDGTTSFNSVNHAESEAAAKAAMEEEQQSAGGEGEATGGDAGDAGAPHLLSDEL